MGELIKTPSASGITTLACDAHPQPNKPTSVTMDAPSPYDGDLSLPDIETVTIDAVRGSDGLIGVQILSHTDLSIHNIVVVVEEGSEAERQGLLKLGDVVVEVDGLGV